MRIPLQNPTYVTWYCILFCSGVTVQKRLCMRSRNPTAWSIVLFSGTPKIMRYSAESYLINNQAGSVQKHVYQNHEL